jgi:putative endopeptidase
MQEADIITMKMKKTAAFIAATLIGLAAVPAFALSNFNVKLNATGVTKRPAISEDYYLNQNFDWLKHNKIPATESDYSTTTMIELSIEDRLSEITKNCLKTGDKLGETSDEARIANLRRCISDVKGRNKTGLGALAAPLKRIEAVKTLDEYTLLMAKLGREYGLDGVTGGFGVTVDPFTADVYRSAIGGPSLGLGKEFYEQQGIGDYLKAYTDYIAKMLTLCGRPRAQAVRSARGILAMQQDLAKHALSVADSQNPSKSLSKLKLAEVKKLLGRCGDVTKVLNAAGVGPANGADVWLVEDKGLIKYANSIYTPKKLRLYKDYAIYRLLSSYADALPEKYAKPARDFDNFISGITKLKSQTRRDDILCEDYLPLSYGRLYGKKYFSEADKKEVTSYVSLIMDEYRKKLKNIDWMSEATKKQALKKLDTMAVRIGYPGPGEWQPIIDLIRIKSPKQGGTLIGNVLGITKTSLDYSYGLLNKPVDRKIWSELPQTVNAGYVPSDNSINFPAGILQQAFYDHRASRETNLGGVGMVIAHEMTHSFDNNGAQYNEHGAISNWWTENDYKEFEKRQANVIKFYDRYKFSGGMSENGTQTLSENIADLGAMSCLTSIVGDDPAKLREVYANFAVIWRSLLTDEELRSYMTDVHSVPYVRVDAVLSSTDGFYKAYDVKPGDPMYAAPEERARLW